MEALADGDADRLLQEMHQAQAMADKIAAQLEALKSGKTGASFLPLFPFSSSSSHVN
jgi:hypothetical protein